ncbi:hypothetical protein GCM10027568_00500 [Humibacter soli]
MPASSSTRPAPVPFVPAPEDAGDAAPLSDDAGPPVGVRQMHTIPSAGDGGSSTDDPSRTGGVGGPDWTAFGPLAPFVAGDGVTDVFVNGQAGLWVDAGSGAVRHPSWSCDERSLRALAVRLVALGGRHVDEANPCVDVRLAGGIRIHVVLPPVSTTGTLVSIRVPRQVRFTLEQLDAAGMLGPHRPRIERAVLDRANLLITGAGGTGKTTLLSALLATAPEHERIVCIEDVAELHVRHPHVVALEARQANLEGAGGIGLDRLVREALRMRPDRLVVGECRGAEVRELMSALNTGHDGGAGTLHANSMNDVPARLEALGALAGMDASALARQAVSAFDLVVHLQRERGVRTVSGCATLACDPVGRLIVREVDP